MGIVHDPLIPTLMEGLRCPQHRHIQPSGVLSKDEEVHVGRSRVVQRAAQ
jgi:hypothetical protein